MVQVEDINSFQYHLYKQQIKASAIISPQVKFDIINKMFSFNTMQAILLLTILTAPAAAVTITFQNQAISSTFYSSYTLGYVSSGTNITVIVNPLAGASYNIKLFRPNEVYPANPAQTAGPFTSAQSNTFLPTDISGSWRVEVEPTSTDFVFSIKIYLASQIIGDYYGIASKGRVFSVYYQTGAAISTQLSISAGSLSNIEFAVYGPFNSLSVSGGTRIAPISSSDLFNSFVNFTASSNSYYYIVLKPNTDVLKSNILIRLIYQTDVYACPYTTGASDYNSNFYGCSDKAPTRGYPCLIFTNGKCTSCASPYKAVDGICIIDLSCPDGQYFHFGQCYNVIPFCQAYDKMGYGTCWLCKSGYKITNYNNGSQSCDQIAPTCKDNQYLVGNSCVGKVENCANFITLNGTCKDCLNGYKLENNKCNLIPQSNIVNCGTGKTYKDGGCVDIDPYCIFYGYSSICQLCATGWQVGSTYNSQGQSIFACVKITCKAKQYSSKGYCDDVSPTCDSFDPIYGTCITCIPNYVLQVNGTCVQSAPGVTEYTKQDCQAGYYMLSGTCVQVSPLCLGYDSKTGLCTSCKDTKYYYLVAGICQEIQTFCANQPRTYFSQGSCVPISKYCDQYDPVTGNCYTCFDYTFIDAQTLTCKFKEICNSTQYKGIYGNCITGNVNCTSFDQNTGACLTCINNFDLNGNTCCRHDSYIDTDECKPFLKQNCKQNKYSNVTGCQECSPGFTKPLGTDGYPLYYSKCVPNK